MTRRPPHLGRTSVVALVLAVLSGCVTEKTKVDNFAAIEAARPKPAAATGAAGDVAGGGGTPEVMAKRAGDTRTSHVLAEVQPRGTIPYDNMTLPLVSPDGRYIVTQTGLSPEWSSVLAQRGALVPELTRLEIYELSGTGNDPPYLHASVTEEAVLLGRSCDADGFIVEAPQLNGSRWLGHASWTTGEVTWIVQEESVAAFGVLGPDGRLAYSSRGLDDEHFDLVVRMGEEEWRLEARGADWLMPTWACAGEGNGLFALMLRGDMLDAVHMDASSETRMRRTIQRLPLANSNADPRTAYQTIAGGVVTPAVGSPVTRDAFVFFHPVRFRMAVWRPPGFANLLDRQSFAALIDTEHEESVLLSTQTDLVRRRVDDERSRSKLLRGMYVPRRTDDDVRQYILLQPNDGVIGITVMRLLPAGAVVETGGG
jgi:hypothetical protein